MIEVLKSGGIFMIPILLCAFAATFIIIERVLFFRSIKKTDSRLLFDLDKFLFQKNYDGAVDFCKNAGTPLASVIVKAVECRKFSSSEIREYVMNEANRQIPVLEHFITPLGTIANISTLLGLLGTVTGNIGAFGVLGSGGTMGNPEILAGAIAEALVTTAAGLIVSIPALIFHNHFVSRVNRAIMNIEASSSEVVLRLERDRT